MTRLAELYRTGRQSLRRLLAYDVANAEPIVHSADALVPMADWDLLYEHRSLALETYEATHDFLKREGVEPTAMDALFCFVERQRFRPRVADGEFRRSTPVELRYYLDD